MPDLQALTLNWLPVLFCALMMAACFFMGRCRHSESANALKDKDNKKTGSSCH